MSKLFKEGKPMGWEWTKAYEVMLSCGNMKEGNWLDKEYREYFVFCGIGIDCMKHYVEECPKVCT